MGFHGDLLNASFIGNTKPSGKYLSIRDIARRLCQIARPGRAKTMVANFGDVNQGFTNCNLKMSVTYVAEHGLGKISVDGGQSGLFRL
jgi:hypothetical protein